MLKSTSCFPTRSRALSYRTPSAVDPSRSLASTIVRLVGSSSGLASWREGLIGYLPAHSPYDEQVLSAELVRRNEQGGDPLVIFEEFVLRALGGDL